MRRSGNPGPVSVRARDVRGGRGVAARNQQGRDDPREAGDEGGRVDEVGAHDDVRIGECALVEGGPVQAAGNELVLTTPNLTPKGS